MSIEEKRKHSRTKTNNLVSYVGIDDGGNEIEEELGKIRNVSLGGILMETIKPIGTQDILLTGIGINEELIDIEGKVVHRLAEDSGKFRTGIQFLENNERTRLFIISLIKDYSKQKTQ